MKRLLFCALMILCSLSLGGCWNYNGLDTLDIVTGIAIDAADQPGIYNVTFELIDTSTAEGKPKAKYVEGQGRTILEAIRNTKKRLINRLYNGNLKALIISHQIAETEGIADMMEDLLRDPEPRETMVVVISREDTAREVLMTDGIDSGIIAYEIYDMVVEDNRITASTVSMPLYLAYDAIRGTGSALALPTLHVVNNNDDRVAESDGIALFRGDKLIGFKTSEDTLLYLFVVDKVTGGFLSFPVDESGDNLSMEIKTGKTDTEIQYLDGRLRLSLKIQLSVNVTETRSKLDVSLEQDRDWLERAINQHIQTRIEHYFREVQTGLRTDIFGIGQTLYRQDPNLWRSLEGRWEQVFQEAELSVEVNANIAGAGVLKGY